jgi:hypothetical protein
VDIQVGAAEAERFSKAFHEVHRKLVCIIIWNHLHFLLKIPFCYYWCLKIQKKSLCPGIRRTEFGCCLRIYKLIKNFQTIVFWLALY